MISRKNAKRLRLGFLLVSFLSLFVFFLFGLFLTLSSLDSILNSFGAVGFIQYVYLALGVYVVFRSGYYLLKLFRRREKHHIHVFDFLHKRKTVLKVVFGLLIFQAIIFYTGIVNSFHFYLQAALFLPVFLLSNISFVMFVFIDRFGLSFIKPVVQLILPFCQILYTYFVIKIVYFVSVKAEK